MAQQVLVSRILRVQVACKARLPAIEHSPGGVTLHQPLLKGPSFANERTLQAPTRAPLQVVRGKWWQ